MHRRRNEMNLKKNAIPFSVAHVYCASCSQNGRWGGKMELIKWRQTPNWRVTNEMKLNSLPKENERKTHTNAKWNENWKWIKHSQLCKMEKFCVFWVLSEFQPFSSRFVRKIERQKKKQLFCRRNPICVIWLTWYEMHKQCTLHSVQRSHLHKFVLFSTFPFAELFKKYILVLFAIHFSTWCAQL